MCGGPVQQADGRKEVRLRDYQRGNQGKRQKAPVHSSEILGLPDKQAGQPVKDSPNGQPGWMYCVKPIERSPLQWLDANSSGPSGRRLGSCLVITSFSQSMQKWQQSLYHWQSS